MSWLIRKAEASDFSAIQALNGELFAYETAFSDEYNLDWMYEDRGIDYFMKRLLNENGNAILLVAEHEEEVVGYIGGLVNHYSFRSVNKIAELENMFVEEHYRNQGVGSGLMEAFLSEAKGLGAKKCKVGLLRSNGEAEQFYRKLGFLDFELILERTLS